MENILANYSVSISELKKSPSAILAEAGDEKEKIMSTLTLRIADTKYERLKKYAKSKDISLNKLFDELATIALTQYDAKTRFDTLARKGDKKRGLELLDKLDNSL